jgi:fluoride exporter
VSLPIDPDLDGPDTSAPIGSSPFGQSRRSRWPRPRWDVLAVVFVGGCLGGWARYGITSTWPARTGRFPWATFDVNVAGAFVLAVVVVVAADVVSSRYLRPLLGTGFCGAFTTFSAIVVTTDQLFAHHHQRIAVAYVSASIAAGLAAAALGLALARVATASRRRVRRERSPS